MPQTISKDMLIKDVVTQFPETMEVFFGYGIGCVGCYMSEHETLEQGCDVHGIQVDELIEDLNMVVNEL